MRSARLALTALLAVAAAAATPISSHASFGCTGTGPIAGYLNWYDNTSPGMVSDNIHILDPGAPASGCVTVGGGQGVSWGSSGYGQETYVTMPPGTYGGPVRVYVNNYLNFAAVLVSLRVTQSDTNGNNKPSLPMRWRVVVHEDFDTHKMTAYDMRYPDGGN